MGIRGEEATPKSGELARLSLSGSRGNSRVCRDKRLVADGGAVVEVISRPTWSIAGSMVGKSQGKKIKKPLVPREETARQNVESRREREVLGRRGNKWVEGEEKSGWGKGLSAARGHPADPVGVGTCNSSPESKVSLVSCCHSASSNQGQQGLGLAFQRPQHAEAQGRGVKAGGNAEETASWLGR